MLNQEFAFIPDAERQLLDVSLREVPVKLSGLAKSLGVAVLASTLPAGISGELRPTGKEGRFEIRVNRHDAPNRQRFTVAHELAHYVLHKDQIGDGIAEDVLYRSGLSDSREAEANRLAAQILMPEEHVRRISDEINAEGDAKVQEMASRFQVSEVAMRIRLESLRLL